MTDSQKAAAYDAIREIVAAAKQTADHYGQQENMGSHVETVQAHAFRQIVKRFLTEA